MLLRSSNLIVKLLKKECMLISTTARVLNDDGDRNQKDAAAKLNDLLLSIAKEEKTVQIESPVIQVPKPRVKLRLKKSQKVFEEKKDLGTQIVDAAKNIASKIKGDNKEIEAQLLHKLLYKDSSVKEEILQASSDNQSLRDLLSKMKIERHATVSKKVKSGEQTGEYSRAAQVRDLLGKYTARGQPAPRREQRVNLFGEKPLGVFEIKTCHDKGVMLKTWAACEMREMKLSVSHPPTNHLEQMIDWTEKGMLWKFPINNEQGLDKEKGVSFASHVLLESQLEGWCPSGGPIRHFMELVCVGLSRNHWLSAIEKEQHITWYRDFFTERRQLVKELGAGEIPSISS